MCFGICFFILYKTFIICVCCCCANTLLRFGYLTYKLAFLRYVTGQGKNSVHQLTGFSEPVFPPVTWNNGYFTVLMNILYVSTYSSDCIKLSPITGAFDRPLPFPRLQKNKLRQQSQSKTEKSLLKLSLCPQIPPELPQK